MMRCAGGRHACLTLTEGGCRPDRFLRTRAHFTPFTSRRLHAKNASRRQSHWGKLTPVAPTLLRANDRKVLPCVTSGFRSCLRLRCLLHRQAPSLRPENSPLPFPDRSCMPVTACRTGCRTCETDGMNRPPSRRFPTPLSSCLRREMLLP